MNFRAMGRMLGAIDICAAVTTPFIAYYWREWLEVDAWTLPTWGFYFYVASTSIGSLLCLRMFRASLADWRHYSQNDAVRATFAIVLGVGLGGFTAFVQDRLSDVARSVPIIHIILQTLIFAGSRWIAQAAARSRKPARRPVGVLVIGCNATANTFLKAVRALSHGTLEVAAVLAEDPNLVGHTLQGARVVGTVSNAREAIASLRVHGIDIARIVIALPPSEVPDADRAKIEEVARLADISIIHIHDLFHAAAGERDEEEETFIATEMNLLGGYRPFKHAIDAIGAGLLIVLLLPLMFLVAVAVAMDVGSPIIFWQKRLGQGGRAFTVYKFRTMRNPFNRSGRLVPDSERAGRIGLLLRRLRLDELPQLFNVLVGDMSFVGPRPLLPVDQPADIRERLSVRPGVTGWAQVNGGVLVTPEDKRALDLWYIGHANLLLDFKIVLRTLDSVLHGEVLGTRALDDAKAWLAERERAIDLGADIEASVSGPAGERRMEPERQRPPRSVESAAAASARPGDIEDKMVPRAGTELCDSVAESRAAE